MRRYHHTMRHAMNLIFAGTLALSGCATITDNVSIDVRSIVASSCQQLASGFADQLADVVADVDAGATGALPDVDVAGLIARASDLGCSPDDLEALITEKLSEIEATSEGARNLLDQVSDSLGEPAGG